ncbi:hypothetical protein RJT34_24651 [Clitoria ternatea]|uniref:DYW domain-containing protein n=1 Tax=Clitoria ternatea TaxID=43366 RepID=A0AAN9FV49_CLITE
MLNSCRKHMDLDIGEEVPKRLLDLEPNKAENYVLLSNLYARLGKWDDVRKEKEKIKILKNHSKKLAISFGLLSTAKGKTLRICKNLCICIDCHNAIKLVSKVVEGRLLQGTTSAFIISKMELVHVEITDGRLGTRIVSNHCMNEGLH